MGDDHSGRLPLKYLDYRTDDTQLAHFTKGEIASVRDYILDLLREIAQLKAKVTQTQTNLETAHGEVDRLECELSRKEWER